MAEKKLVGKITHYFEKIGVAVVELNDTLRVGDKISIESSDSKVEQRVDSMQIEHKQVGEAGKGKSVGMKVSGRVHVGASVFKVEESDDEDSEESDEKEDESDESEESDEEEEESEEYA